MACHNSGGWRRTSGQQPAVIAWESTKVCSLKLKHTAIMASTRDDNSCLRIMFQLLVVATSSQVSDSSATRCLAAGHTQQYDTNWYRPKGMRPIVADKALSQAKFATRTKRRKDRVCTLVHSDVTQPRKEEQCTHTSVESCAVFLGECSSLSARKRRGLEAVDV